MPESSANAGWPVARAAARAFATALASNVSPVSGGSSTSSGSPTTSTPSSNAPNSRALWGLRLARTSFTSRGRSGDHALLHGAQLGDALGGEREQRVEVRPRQ